MSFKRIAFAAFAGFSVIALMVTSILAWKSIHAEKEAHEGTHGQIEFGSVGDFSFTDQDGKAVQKKDLLGRVWIAGFIFTNCSGPCPKLSSEMASLHKALEKSDVQLVSFTVDPDRDSPQVLKSYSESYEADPKKWSFLTGDKSKMHPFIRDSFKLAVEEPSGDDRLLSLDIAHSSKLVLVDRDAKIKGYFAGTDPVAVETLKHKAQKLAASRQP